MSSNLFFVKHNFKEEEIKDGKSHLNIHEAEFVVELCKYLLHQEYKPSQITILTTYTGQLFCLRKLMPAKIFDGVKVHVVDKYQGEENDIVLLSLVRSNKEGRVGFLRIANRICVALSRAKMGLYCIGNMDMLSSVPLWRHIIHTLQDHAQIDDHLPLYCQNHPETRNSVKCAKDFESVPEGGCDKSCETRLECGHVCTRACHPYDQDHKQYQCNKDCQKSCIEGHKCRLKCYLPCGECMVKVEKLIPSCGHLQMVPCSVPEDVYSCMKPCEKTLVCGHGCSKHCGEKCEVDCRKEVSAQLKCGHTQTIRCWEKRDLESGIHVRCKHPCRASLSCGHQCSGSCDGCFQGRFHMGCTHPCKATLVCSHECSQPCTRDCPPCSNICQNRCIHSQCKKTCGERCVPCKEPCFWSCEHYQCSRLCSEPCDRPPCNIPCKKQLKCQHQCIGLCGEPCPKKCRICDKDEVTEIFFGFEDDEDACFVELEDCGHILESNSMDTYMEGQSDTEEGSAIKLKECPKCKTPIRRNLRYGTIINKTLSEIENVKERIRGSSTEKEETRIRLQTSLSEMVNFKSNFPREHKEFLKKVNNRATQLRTLLDLENRMIFYERLAKLLDKIHKADAEDVCDLEERLEKIEKWMQKSGPFLSEQELSDLQTEVARITYLLQLLVKWKQAKARVTPDIQKELTFLRDILQSDKPFTTEDEALVKTKLKELDKTLPNKGLGITEDERVSIVRAMGLTKGHWFKCPNNHIYCITECGGAMEESKCPECKEKIGGTSHALLSSNRLASEMDGAQHAAWSEVGNNMMNFQDLQE